MFIKNCEIFFDKVNNIKILKFWQSSAKPEIESFQNTYESPTLNLSN